MTENDVRERMVDLLEAHREGMTILSIAAALKVNRNTVTKYIYELSGAGIIAQRQIGSAKLCFLAKPHAAKAMLKARKEAKIPGFLPLMVLLPLLLLSVAAQPALATNTQSHPLSELTPVDTDLDMTQYDIINAAWINGTSINASNQICVGGICRTSWPAGTVTSVGLSMPTFEFTVTNSPVTSSGTLTASWSSQNANLVFASPSGSSGTPTFRSLAATDIPSHVHAGGDITTGTITNARLDTNLGWLNNTQIWTAAQTINSLILGGNMNANANSITGAVWLNATNVNATRSVNSTQFCIGTDCRTAWPASGGGTGNVTGIGVQGNLSMWYNSTEINTSAIFQKAGNIGIGSILPVKTLDVVGTINATSQYCLGTGTTATCVSSWPFNTSAQVIAAINNTGLDAGNMTLGTLMNARLDASVKRVNDSATLNISNITAPSDCASANYVYGFSNKLSCRADLFNTSTEVNSALNSSFFTLNRPWAAGTLGWGNVSARSLDIVWLGSLNAQNISGTLANARLDASVKRVNDTATLNISNITAPSDCAANNYVYGFGSTLSCRADQAGNTSAQVIMAINNTGLGAGNITLGTLTNARLDSKIHFINNTAQLLTAGNLTTATLNQTHLISSFLINAGNVSGLTTGNVTGIGTQGNISLWFNTTALNASVLFQKGGNIGINTVLPLNALDVVGNVNATGAMFVGTWLNATSVNATRSINSTQFCIGTDCRTAWPATGGTGNVTGIGTQGNISLWFNTTALNSSVLFQYNNKIGIGTILPLNALDVVGIINTTQGINISAGIENQIVFGTDTNLYRSAANVLTTDDSFIAGGTWLNATNVNASSSVYASTIRLGTTANITWNGTHLYIAG